jgi:hypothetical protein
MASETSNEAKLEWQAVETNHPHIRLHRAKVPGGWLVVMNGQSITFVPIGDWPVKTTHL